jgi:Fe-S cluster assembly scaffold protein SufB
MTQNIMEILEFRSQNLIIGEGESKELFISVLPYSEKVFSNRESRNIVLDIILKKDSNLKLYILGILDKSETKIELNSVNLGENSSLEVKAGFVQFGDSNLEFQGLMKIEKNSSSSNADLHVESLLLSSEAKANLIPSMEISENEVSASHGAVVRNLDPDEIFYLRSRGIPVEIANELLILGFLNGFGIKLPNEVRNKFEKAIANLLSGEVCPLNCSWCK